MTDKSPKNQRPYARPEGYLTSTFWHDPLIHTLPLPTRLLALYLMTSPYTTVDGRVTDSIESMGEAIEAPQDQVEKGIQDLLSIGFLREQGDGWQIHSPHFIGSMEE